MGESPPTIIVVHPKERRSKCSMQPLRGREGFVFWKYPRRGEQPLDNYVRLGFGGPLISPEDRERGLLILDGTWRWAASMEADYADVPIRSLPPWKTAYPRVSQLFEDPSEGLATIEALFAAYYLMGRDTEGLLEEYRWGEEFRRLNGIEVGSRKSEVGLDNAERGVRNDFEKWKAESGKPGQARSSPTSDFRIWFKEH